MTRLRTFPALVVILTLIVLGAVTLLESRADASRSAQVRLGGLDLALTDLTPAPFSADRVAQGPSAPARARAEIRVDEAALARGFGPHSGLAWSSTSGAAMSDLAGLEMTVGQIYRVSARASGVGGSKLIPGLQRRLAGQTARLSGLLHQAGQADARRAQRARLIAAAGTAVAMLILLAGFVFFYARSERARRENARLLGISRHEARTDALTGLGNRRALQDDLTDMDPFAPGSPEVLLAIFDLNGFKHYNDRFGHSAGDALLARLGERFARAVEPAGSAYRMGGDEFCLLARCDAPASESLLAAAAVALTEQGDGWSIGCPRGATRIPAEAATAAEALSTADGRMYLDKAARAHADAHLADLPT